jgi:hypothetical protein
MKDQPPFQCCGLDLKRRRNINNIIVKKSQRNNPTNFGLHGGASATIDPILQMLKGEIANYIK